MKQLTKDEKKKIIHLLENTLIEQETVGIPYLFKLYQSKISASDPGKLFYKEIVFGINKLFFFVWQNNSELHKKHIKLALQCIIYFLNENDFIKDRLENGLQDDYYALQFTLSKLANLKPTIHLNWILDSIYLDNEKASLLSNILNENSNVDSKTDLIFKVTGKIEILKQKYPNSAFISTLIEKVNFLKDNIDSPDLKGYYTQISNALHYFQKSEDSVPDYHGEFAYFDDYYICIQTVNLIKDAFYKKKEMDILSSASLRYDELFHFILITRNNETVRLSDRHKWIAMLGFEAGLAVNRSYFLFTPDELFSKSIYLLFFLIGIIIDAINKNVTDEIIIEELRKKKYVYTDTLKNKNTQNKEKFVFKLKEIDDKKELIILTRGKKDNSGKSKDTEEIDQFKISISKKTFVERIKNGIYHFSEAKTYTAKKIFEHNEQEIFLNEVIREIQQSYYKTEYNENLFFSALKIDHVSYFGTNFSVLSELHSLALNGLSCSELFPFYKWNNEGLSEPTKECSNQKSSPGTVFINVFNEYGLFFSQLKSKPELFHKILLDFENISKYNNDRERIQEKLNNFLRISANNKHTMICYDTLINYDRYKYEEKPLGLMPVLITYDDYKISDSFLNIIETNKSIKNFNKTNIDCILLSEDSFSKSYNAIWKNAYKISDSEKLKINNDFVYPYYKSLFDLDDTIVGKIFERSVEYLLSLSTLESSYNDILKLLEYKESPRLNILYQLLEQYKSSSEKIAIVGTENTTNYLAKYIPNKYPNLNIDLLTKGRVLRNTDYDIIILTSFPGNIFLDFYYSTHAKNIHFILYPHENNIFLKKIGIIQNLKQNPAIKENLKYAYGEKYNVKEIISFKEKEQIVTTFEEEIEQINRAKILEEIEKGIKLKANGHIPMVTGKIFEFSDGNYRVFDKNSKVYTLVPLQQGNGSILHTQKVNLLREDDQILILDNSYGYSYDESINEILLENIELKEKYNKTQIWRQELNKFYNEKTNNNIHELKHLFDKANLIRNELTIHNWLFKKYQISTMSYKKEIPLILSLIGSTLTKENISYLLDEIQEFISIRFTLGRFFKRLLIESITNGKNIYDSFNESYTNHLQKNKLFKDKDNTHLIQKLFTLRNNVKFLAIVNIVPEEIILPTNSDLFKRPLRLEDVL